MEKKKTQIKKTNDPGPTSYHVHDTVGVIAEFNRYEVNPREGSQKKTSDWPAEFVIRFIYYFKQFN